MTVKKIHSTYIDIFRHFITETSLQTRGKKPGEHANMPARPVVCGYQVISFRNASMILSFFILLTAYIIVTNITKNTPAALIKRPAQGNANPASSADMTLTINTEHSSDSGTPISSAFVP